MRICVIFNPAARGNKARRFRRRLDAIGSHCALKATAAPGDARRLAAEAVGEGYDLIVAAGGDGTVNEVLNGIGDLPDQILADITRELVPAIPSHRRGGARDAAP